MAHFLPGHPPFISINCIKESSRTQRDLSIPEFLSFGKTLGCIGYHTDYNVSYKSLNPEIGMDIMTYPLAFTRYSNAEAIAEVAKAAAAHIHVVPLNAVPWSYKKGGSEKEPTRPEYRRSYRECISVREHVEVVMKSEPKKTKWRKVEGDWHFVVPGTSIAIDDKPLALLCIRDIDSESASETQKNFVEANERELYDLCEEFGIKLFTLYEKQKSPEESILDETIHEDNEKTRRELFEHLKGLLNDGASPTQLTKEKVLEDGKQAEVKPLGWEWVVTKLKCISGVSSAGKNKGPAKEEG